MVYGFVFIVCGSGLNAQTGLNMEYFGNVNTRSVPGARYSACWGYTAVDGHEYALLGCDSGTAIIDIQADPPVEVDFVYGPKNGWREMKTYLHYAYIVSESSDTLNGAGVQIVDLRNLPDSASLIKTFIWTHFTGERISRVHSVSVSGNYLYLNGGSFIGIRILDISNPENPIQAGSYYGPYIHDSHIRNDTIYGSAINSGGGLDIVDATNKANPTRIQLLQYPGSGTHNAWTTLDGKHVLTTDEIGTTPKTLKIWNIANLTNIQYVTEYSNTISIVHNVFIKGNLAYVAWYADRLKVVDISNPASPQLAGYYDTYPGAPEANYVGVWGADPYFPSGKVILSDMSTGLHVVRYTGDKRGVVNGMVTDYWSGAPLPDVILHFPELAISRWTDAGGNFIFGFAPGTFKVRMERPGFGPFETTLTVTENETTAVNLAPFSLTSVQPGPVGPPSQYSLNQNYPNPFNPTTTVSYSLPREEYVTLKVYNILGKELFTVLEGQQSAGEHSVNTAGRALASGLYFYRLTAGPFVSVRAMTVLK